MWLENKKTIALLPIKNEAWILPTTLSYLSKFCDQIIIADQMSTDGSIKIYKNFPKVKVIENQEKFHSNKVRWRLLDEARKIDGDNIFIFLDADEFISPLFFEKELKEIIENEDKGLILQFKWINLWKDKKEYRSDRYWNKLKKPAIFIDDRKSDYIRNEVINDHTSRVPYCSRKIQIKKYPIIHTEYLYWKKSQIKQSWYMCSELIKSPKKYKKINYKYRDTKNSRKVETTETKEEWTKGIDLPNLNYFIKEDWRYKEILKWFNKYDIAFFESLDIWHIKELENKFIKKNGRKPKSRNYPNFILFLNDIKNKIKNEILK
jgi:hypothetical protein